MVGLGFKLPHLAVHVPWQYYEMYRNRTDAFALSKKELRFPPSAPEASYRIGFVSLYIYDSLSIYII